MVRKKNTFALIYQNYVAFLDQCKEMAESLNEYLQEQEMGELDMPKAMKDLDVILQHSLLEIAIADGSFSAEEAYFLRSFADYYPFTDYLKENVALEISWDDLFASGVGVKVILNSVRDEVLKMADSVSKVLGVVSAVTDGALEKLIHVGTEVAASFAALSLEEKTVVAFGDTTLMKLLCLVQKVMDEYNENVASEKRRIALKKSFSRMSATKQRSAQEERAWEEACKEIVQNLKAAGTSGEDPDEFCDLVRTPEPKPKDSPEDKIVFRRRK
mgnify:CR=1 FL=1